MKLVWQSALMFSSFVLLPATLVFLIYSIGASILLGHVEVFAWALTAFLGAVIVQTALAILSE